MSQPLQYCQIPPQNVPFLNPDGTVSIVWYRFLHDLHLVSGANTPGHAITQWSGTAGGFNNAQIGYEPQVVATGTSPKLIVYDQITGTGSPVNKKYPVGFVVLTPFV